MRVSRASAPASTPKAPKARPARISASSQSPQRPTASEVKIATPASSSRPTTTQAAAVKAIFSATSEGDEISPRRRRASAWSSRSEDIAAAASSTPASPRLTSRAPAKPKADSGSRPSAPSFTSSSMGARIAFAAGRARSRLLPVSAMKLSSGAEPPRRGLLAGRPQLALDVQHQRAAAAQPQRVPGAAVEADGAAVLDQVHEAQHLVDVAGRQALVEAEDRRLQAAARWRRPRSATGGWS